MQSILPHLVADKLKSPTSNNYFRTTLSQCIDCFLYEQAQAYIGYIINLMLIEINIIK